MQANLLYRRNPLAYPASTVPGVNPSHRAAQGLRFSGVAAPGGFISLNQGRRGTVAGASPSFAIDGRIGSGFFSASGADAVNFTVQSTVNDASATIAAIASFNSVAAGQCLFSSSGTNAGWRLIYNTTQVTMTAGSVGDINSGIGLTANTPYLIISSANASASNFFVLNLATGKITTASAAGAAPAAPNGTYQVGNNVFNQPQLGRIAAVMFSANFMTLTEMRQWALDPWAFWYPCQTERLVAAAAAATFLAAWAQQSNLPVLGTGTY